jgi:hypothetical protein
MMDTSQGHRSEPVSFDGHDFPSSTEGPPRHRTRW